jgi:RNA recognition motif-containing protein
MPYNTQEFFDYMDAEYAIKEMNDKKIEGFRLTVELSGKKKGRPTSRSRSRSHHRARRDRYTHN